MRRGAYPRSHEIEVDPAIRADSAFVAYRMRLDPAAAGRTSRPWPGSGRSAAGAGYPQGPAPGRPLPRPPRAARPLRPPGRRALHRSPCDHGIGATVEIRVGPAARGRALVRLVRHAVAV